MSNDNPDPPPVAGRWKPGQSGNPKGRPPRKPITEGLQAIFDQLDKKQTEEYSKALWKKAAMGDIAAYKEVADRVEGRVPQSVGGSTTRGPVKLKVEWSE